MCNHDQLLKRLFLFPPISKKFSLPYQTSVSVLFDHFGKRLGIDFLCWDASSWRRKRSPEPAINRHHDLQLQLQLKTTFIGGSCCKNRVVYHPLRISWIFLNLLRVWSTNSKNQAFYCNCIYRERHIHTLYVKMLRMLHIQVAIKKRENVCI